jgi:hypothetical protein
MIRIMHADDLITQDQQKQTKTVTTHGARPACNRPRKATVGNCQLLPPLNHPDVR